MKIFPILETERLLLRQLEMGDAPRIFEILNDSPEIAKNVLSFPYPYPAGRAEAWIEQTYQDFAEGTGFSWAVIHKTDQLLIANVNMIVREKHRRGGLGYWLAKPYWGKGYMTEAVKRVLQFGFEDHQLNRIYAECFVRNLASEKVMLKVGMTYEGTLREVVLHESGEFHDLKQYGILRREYHAAKLVP